MEKMNFSALEAVILNRELDKITAEVDKAIKIIAAVFKPYNLQHKDAEHAMQEYFRKMNYVERYGEPAGAGDWVAHQLPDAVKAEILATAAKTFMARVDEIGSIAEDASNRAQA